MNDRFTLHPGRQIHKNGKPWLHVTYNTDANGNRSCEPSEADAAARVFTALLNAAVDEVDYALKGKPLQ